MSTDGIKYYIGVRQSKIEPEKDSYYGSFYDKNFKPNHKKILGIHDNRNDAIQAEIYWHNLFQVDKNPLFVNQSKQTSNKFDYDWTGKFLSQETKNKLSKFRIEYYKTNAHPWTNRKHSQESKEKMSKSLSGKNSPWYGKSHKESTKKKQSEAKKSRVIYIFFCCATSEIFTGTPSDFIEYTNLSRCGVSYLINLKRIMYADWILL